MKVTLEKLAAMTGVSIATVSRVLNGSPAVSPETRLRVLGAARQSGYAGNWKLAGRPLIAVVGRHFESRYHACFLRFLCDELDRSEFQYEVIPGKHVSLLSGRPVSGMILTSSRSSFPEGSLPDVPLVGINEEEDPVHDFHSVQSDLETGMEQALERLFRLGHRRIALWLRSRGSFLDRNREAVFLAASRKFPGLAPLVAEGWDTVTVLGELRLRKTTALFAPVYDDILPIYHALTLLNWKAPEEVSVIAHGSDEISRFLLPRPTELRADFAAICREAVNMLKKRIAGEKVPGNVKIPYLYIPGDSIGPPPGGRA
ncbi:MAG: LacI family DNA-binding transcriptional regulator [Lentisphaeria bacterium]|nr:LacI family DNA-binding transcriptional regulator [Lentisphaeria bacterium]